MLACSILLDQTYSWQLYEGSKYFLYHHRLVVAGPGCAHLMSTTSGNMETSRALTTKYGNYTTILNWMFVSQIWIQCFVSHFKADNLWQSVHIQRFASRGVEKFSSRQLNRYGSLFMLTRCQTLNNHVSSSESSFFTLIWTILELDVAIMCGCLLLMKPLFQSCVQYMQREIVRLSSGSQSRGSDMMGESPMPHGGYALEYQSQQPRIER